jgi:hypothetical protein
MAVAADEWLRRIELEYVDDFVGAGGGAIKFIVGDDNELLALRERLGDLTERHGLIHLHIDAAATRLHMIQDVFFAVARALDWHGMAQRFVESLLERQGYAWPHPGEPVPIEDVAAHNGVALALMRRDVRQWLSAEVMRDTEMTQDFRIAMTRLCLHRLEPEDGQLGVTTPVLEWLRGELPRIGALKDVSITAKINRYNGRAMLRSLCRWVRFCGRRGLCVTLDVRQLGRTGAAVGAGLRYSLAAVMDGFEVLRQLIDDIEHFAGLLVVVLADVTLTVEGSSRSVGKYPALKMRIWDDVRPEGRDNPLAPLVRLTGATRPEPIGGLSP